MKPLRGSKGGETMLSIYLCSVFIYFVILVAINLCFLDVIRQRYKASYNRILIVSLSAFVPVLRLLAVLAIVNLIRKV